MAQRVPVLTLHILTVCLIGMALFQLLLALGAPLGQAAWGGTYTVLPRYLRAESIFSAFLFLCGIVVFRGRAGILRQRPTIFFFRFGSIILAIMFTLSTLLNIASTSRWENFLMAPIAGIMAICGWIIIRIPPSKVTS